jgi:hypothetical protein
MAAPSILWKIFYKLRLAVTLVFSNLRSHNWSVLQAPQVTWWNGGMTQDEFEARNQVFQGDD